MLEPYNGRENERTIGLQESTNHKEDNRQVHTFLVLIVFTEQISMKTIRTKKMIDLAEVIGTNINETGISIVQRLPARNQ